MMHGALGHQYIVEMYGVSHDFLTHVEEIQAAMRDAVLAAGATIVTESYHQFEPYGVSGMTVVQESHASIHTWPEHGYAAIDLFFCGTEVNVHAAFESLKSHFKPRHTEVQRLPRGDIGQAQAWDTKGD